VDAAVKRLWTEFERLDVVINNAGFYEPMANISASSVDCWWKSMTVNLKGPYLITRACLPYLTKSQPGGQIVNVSSVGAHRLFKGISAYSTAKFALLRFTEFTHAEYSEKGVIAMVVHPGAVATEMGLQNPKSIHHSKPSP
jgi:NAD(P)-dependent dehydrogenase (short-subunit alcohol dehydrogenase family)